MRANLEEHFQRFVNAGKMKPRQMRRLLERFDNPLQRVSFIDPVTGQFEPHLMAMVLATAGTPGEGAIGVILDGENPLGKPPKVEYRDLLPRAFGESLFELNEQGVPVQWIIAIDPIFRDEPFQAGAALISHEALHQDLLQSQNEEIVNTSAEINSWKQQLLINSQLASLRTRITKALNLQVLYHMNSGMRGFPNPGLFQAPLAQDPPNIGPGSNFVDPSLESVIRLGYANVPNVDTPGNIYLDRYLNTVSRAPVSQQNGNGFDQDTIVRLDNINRFYSSADNFRLLQILKLQPVFVPTVTAFGAAVQPLAPTETKQPTLQERY